MKSPRNRASAPVEEAADEFFYRTRELLLTARGDRDVAKLRRGADRLNGERFKALSQSRRSELNGLYDEAMAACGIGSVA